MSPRVVDNRARERVKFATPYHPEDDRVVNGGKPRRKMKRQDPGRDGADTQTGMYNRSFNTSEFFHNLNGFWPHYTL